MQVRQVFKPALLICCRWVVGIGLSAISPQFLVRFRYLGIYRKPVFLRSENRVFRPAARMNFFNALSSA
nr:MAG TPA: hypothetical protein [Microviridae sp.]